jgi:DNA-binding transcriptional regulator YdaS (Cro superfamily)
LRRAAEIVGGEEALSMRLGVTPSHLALWIRAAGEMPDAVFLRAVDIVLEHDVSQLASRSRAELAKDLKPL